MRITTIETIPVSVPLEPARMISSARGAHDRSPFVLVLIHTDAGAVGLGEVSCTSRWSGEDSTTAIHVIDRYLRPRLEGRDPREVARLAAGLEAALVGHHFTKAGVEMALWDLLGKALDAPVHHLLGGLARERLRTKLSIGGSDTQRACSIAAWGLEQGFTAMKLKVAIDTVPRDLARVAAVRETVGNDVLLGVDANGGWQRHEARRAITGLAELGVAFVEQPLAPRDLEGMAELRRVARLPMMADDAVGTPEDALAVVRADAADLLSLYVGMAGGIGPAQRAAAVASAAGLGWTIGSNLELGVGMAAQTQLALAAPGLADDVAPCDVISPSYYPSVLLRDASWIRPGEVVPPPGPGLGVELDLDAVEHYREDRR